MGRGDDGAHSQNERMSKHNLLKGVFEFLLKITFLDPIVWCLLE